LKRIKTICNAQKDLQVQFNYSLFLYFLWTVKIGHRWPSWLDCAGDHAAIFLANAILVASQWQHCVWTFLLHPSINADYGLKATTTLKILRQCFSTSVRGRLWMSPQALRGKMFSVIPSHHNNFINFIQLTFLFVQRLKFT